MKYVLGVIPFVAVIFGIINGKSSEMSAAVLDSATDAVTLALSLCGVMCLWSGLMKVAEQAGLVDKLSRLLSPVISLLFKGVGKGSRAAQLIAMNLTANLLGLGNASTPLGISAMQELSTSENAGDTATDNMVMLTVLNTASLQIIPTTAAALRASLGAQRPMEILPCVWIVSVYAVVVAVAAAKLLSYIGRRRKRNGNN
ncbi:MAG: ABC transporter permease [Oscillospiraceae bacterium]|nr:ABC transporter permease [Oscillospiraceae bacterium]